MKVYVNEVLFTGRVEIWIREGVRYLKPDLLSWEEVPPEQQPSEPTLVLRREVAEALASELTNLGTPGEATQRHLADAVKVRDRLLTLVERGR